MNDAFSYMFVDPVTGDVLDDVGRLFNVIRGVGETDHQLRTRINNILKYQPGPPPHLLKLLVLLEKLGLTSCTDLLDTFLPIGYPRR